jgi:hypothetical protein
VTAVLAILAFMSLVVVMGARSLRGPSRRAIEQREIITIAALREGEPARIRGVAAARGPLLTSPIGGRPCIGYRASIYDHNDRRDVLVVHREMWPSSFLVTDESGTVAVQGPFEIRVDPSDVGGNLPPRAYELLKEDDVRMNDLLGFPQQFRFRETVLKTGDRISVVGRPSRESGAAGRGVSGEPFGPFMVGGTFDEPVVVIDDDSPVGPLGAGTRSFARPPKEPSHVRGPSRRAIERQETIAVVALKERGLAKIQGVVVAREPLLKSPVSGRVCVGYRITIHQGREGYTAENGVLVVRREEWPSFLVADDTGSAVVEGPFSIFLDPDDGGWADLPASVYALLDEAKVPLGKEFSFRETLLQPGDRVSVIGRPSLEIDPAGPASLREPPRLYVFRGSEEDPVALIDDDQPVG